MDIETLRTFAKVAELASFSRAAEQLGLAKARVSTRVQMLEATLGTRLFHRTTRSVRLTPDGELFAERCRSLLEDADELQNLFQRSPSALRGRLRIDMPNYIARSLVVPRLPEFLDAHEGVTLELSCTDRLVDVVHEGFDCVLRVGALANSGLVARRVGMLRLVNCASPAYLAAHGTPRSIEDLAHHKLVHYAATLGSPPAGWEYRDGDKTVFRPMAGAVTVNSSDAYQAAALAGLGLVQSPVLGTFKLVAQGSLVEVLPEYTAAPMPVSLLYPDRRHIAKRVQAFMDWLEEILAPQLLES